MVASQVLSVPVSPTGSLALACLVRDVRQPGGQETAVCKRSGRAQQPQGTGGTALRDVHDAASTHRGATATQHDPVGVV